MLVLHRIRIIIYIGYELFSLSADFCRRALPAPACSLLIACDAKQVVPLQIHVSVEVKPAVKALIPLTKVTFLIQFPSLTPSSVPLLTLPFSFFFFFWSCLQALQAFQLDRQPLAPSAAS